MDNNTKIILGIVVCGIILFGWVLIAVSLGLKNNGGYLVMFVLFLLVSAIWKAITGKNKDPDDNE